MDRVIFADSWQEYFARFGLASFDDFYGYTGGSTINANTKRSVLKISIGQGDEQKVFYIKRFFSPHVKDVLSSWLGAGGVISQAGVEWANAHKLLSNGVGTYKPVCMGERRAFGVERQSFLVTERLRGVCLLDFVLHKWRGLDRDRQEQTVVALGNLVRRIHQLNVVFPDLYLWHIFVHEDDPADESWMSIIDLHRMRQGVRSYYERGKDLARLYWSLSEDYFDKRLKDLLIETYIGPGADLGRRALVWWIHRYAGIVARRKHLVYHYRRPTLVPG